MGKHFWGAAMGRRSTLGLLMLLFACNGHGDDGDDTNAPDPEEQQCESAQIELTNTCFFPNGGDFNDDPLAERPTMTNISEAAEALNGGFYVPRIDPADATEHLGFVLEDNEVCRVSCLTQCDITLYSLCVSALSSGADGGPRGCLFCGEVTREQCQGFIDACE
jgi:hypothetical protein